jgi:thioredoxin-related protein
MKYLKLVVVLTISLMAFACSSPGEKAAEEMCGCVESLGIPADQLMSTNNVEKVNEIKSCVNNVMDKYKDVNEDEKRTARIAFREGCPDIAKALGL